MERPRPKVIRSKLDPVYEEVAGVLSSGYALTTGDVREVYAKHNASPTTSNTLSSQVESKRFFERTGVNASIQRIGRKIVFYDAGLPREDTDLSEVTQILQAEEDSFYNRNS